MIKIIKKDRFRSQPAAVNRVYDLVRVILDMSNQEWRELKTHIQKKITEQTEKPSDIIEVKTTREVIENKLLVGLEDETKVAILASEDDLIMLLFALESVPDASDDRFNDLYNGIKKLKDAAF